MKKTILSFMAALVFVTVACSESNQNKAENETSLQNKKETPPNTDSIFKFDTDEVGKIPVGWLPYFTGKGHLGKWEIREDEGNKVLAQVSQENFGYHFDVIVFDESDFRDLEISVKFKGVKGEEDQGGGPVWRYQDANNYYIARANPLENNFRVYKVIDGNRKQLASANIDIPSGEWHAIKIKMAENHIVCFYDGKKYLDVIDDTFKDSGRIGLWTKADAFTFFDDLELIKKK